MKEFIPIKYYTAKHEVVFMYVILMDNNILKNLIEFILEKKIDEIIILNPNLLTENIKTRVQKLDLLIKSNQEYINIELNSNFNKLIKIRNLLYLFKTVLSQAEKGKKIYDLNKKTIQININFGNKSFNKEELGLYNIRNKQIATDIFKIYNINVDFYVEKYYNNKKKFTQGEEIIIMLGLEKEELSHLAKRSDIVMRYKKLVDEVNENNSLFKWFTADEEREMYEEALMRQSKEEGLIEGKQEGLIEGEKKGKQAGLAESKQAGILSVAKNMLSEGMNIELVSKLTKLSKKQLKSLL